MYQIEYCIACYFLRLEKKAGTNIYELFKKKKKITRIISAINVRVVFLSAPYFVLAYLRPLDFCLLS